MLKSEYTYLVPGGWVRVLSKYNQSNISALVHITLPKGASGGNPELCNNKCLIVTSLCLKSGM